MVRADTGRLRCTAPALRNSSTTPVTDGKPANELAHLRLRYKLPEQEPSR
ncbi:MAG: hypothetical protein M3374_04925 [Pseudomonadota bacterium]|nr:hypothetical protein [Pseudomonadota bacterium]